jgi:hypothetical protein
MAVDMATKYFVLAKKGRNDPVDLLTFNCSKRESILLICRCMDLDNEVV